MPKVFGPAVTPLEVWQYPIPEDASAQTVDWETYISNTKKRPFDSKAIFPLA
jgi:hypothetical protein